MRQSIKIQRSGRVLSAATEAMIREAIDHTQKSLDLLQSILDANTAQTASRRIKAQWEHASIVH
jgi:predicted signal transduction protein with EAL and GGDEF domain